MIDLRIRKGTVVEDPDGRWIEVGGDRYRYRGILPGGTDVDVVFNPDGNLGSVTASAAATLSAMMDF